MLQAEKEKSQKKIADTRKRTQQIRDQIQKNDLKYQQTVAQEKEKNQVQKQKLVDRKKIEQEIQEKKYQIYLGKKKEVEHYKQQKVKQQELSRKQKEEMTMQNFDKMNEVKTQLQEGNQRIKKFMQDKIKAAKDDDDLEKIKNRHEIEEFEREAEELERMEMELLQRLQETQKLERDAYGKLENAMIDTSIPKKQRIVQNTSLNGNFTADGKVKKLDDLEKILIEND